MVYPVHYLTQFGGTVGNVPGEIWSCGIRNVVQNEDPLNNFNPGDGYLVDIVVPALASWFARATSKISNTTKLTYAKCNRIGPDGRYTDSLTHEYFWPVPVAGGASISNMPYQCAVVLSWETNNASRGPGSKGRIYSPSPSVAVTQATGLFAAADALGMAQSAATLLNSLDDSVSLTGQIRPHIVSDVGEGIANEINRVRVDNRVDVQRKRANSVVAQQSIVNFNY